MACFFVRVAAGLSDNTDKESMGEWFTGAGSSVGRMIIRPYLLGSATFSSVFPRIGNLCLGE
jgi:hypothetical protein